MDFTPKSCILSIEWRAVWICVENKRPVFSMTLSAYSLVFSFYKAAAGLTWCFYPTMMKLFNFGLNFGLWPIMMKPFCLLNQSKNNFTVYNKNCLDTSFQNHWFHFQKNKRKTVSWKVLTAACLLDELIRTDRYWSVGRKWTATAITHKTTI